MNSKISKDDINEDEDDDIQIIGYVEPNECVSLKTIPPKKNENIYNQNQSQFFQINDNNSFNYDDFISQISNNKPIQENFNNIDSLISMREISENYKSTSEDQSTTNEIVQKINLENYQIIYNLYRLNFIKKDNNEEACMICLENYNPKAQINCGHFFHSQCLANIFLENKRICPLCKKDI